jgi:type II restriction/modification system DNA methylase subunit YeeA
MALSLPEFVERWKASTLSERAAAQSHFIDLCEVLGQPHPAAVDQSGDTFTFEKHVSTLEDGKGFADVWKRGFFGWEYKGKHKSLSAAYAQLVRYQGDLENPPLLVTCDQERFEVHTNFTGARPLVYSFTLNDLLTAAPTANCALAPLEVLRAVFTNPELLRPEAAQVRVTEHVAEEFAKLADSLERRGVNTERAAHFLMRLLFCLFADSIGLLPDHLFRQMIELDRGKPANFARKLRQLFAAMSNPGSAFGVHDIHYFNGGLFADDEVFDLTSADMAVLKAAAAFDWSQVEPAIFGTLFERGLDPGKRSQLGAHHTSREDILLIVEPVVIEPLQRRWVQVNADATALADAAKTAKGRAHTKLRDELQAKVFGWMEELSAVRVLDPACGSGNFLYLALRRLLDLWHEARLFAAAHGLPTFIEKQVHPQQLFGLETNIYAQELASVVVWIGYLQWLNEHAIGWPVEPILRKLDNIQHRDAILTHDAKGKPIEPEWPEAEFVVGNPPFLGGKRLRKELGDEYVDDLFEVYEGRVARESDLVVYWFEKARALVEEDKVRRVGLLATQGIRGGANRKVLEKIKESGSIFWAYSDRDWILDGAAVHVSMVGFDSGAEKTRMLNGAVVSEINADLTTSTDFTSAAALPENYGLAFMGDTKGGSFDVSQSQAEQFLKSPLNANGRPNSDVVKPWINGLDLGGRPRNMYIIDFESAKSEQDAALYEAPFEYVKKVVLPERQESRTTIDEWWRHERPRPELRKALSGLSRYIVTPRVSRHRLFVFVGAAVIPDSALIAIARDDEYFLGVLHSKLHELWARRKGTQVREVESGFRYTPTSTFETFPFPWPPRSEPKDSPLVKTIAEASRELVAKRDDWLNPPDASAEELRARTLTNLYNARPTWLADAHRNLDEAVFAAYGWLATLTDAELLEHLLALNHDRTPNAHDSIS